VQAAALASASMFDAVSFQNYKCLADVTIELGRMTLLVGANASGKSSVLDGIHLLCQLAVPQPNELQAFGSRAGVVFSDLRSPSRLRTSGRTGALRIEAIKGKGDARSALLVVRAEPSSDSNSENVTVETGPSKGSGSGITVSLAGVNQAWLTFFHGLEAQGFGRAIRLRLDSARVSGLALDSLQPRVEEDGTGTAAVIAWLAEQRAPALEAIEADLRRVVPRARRFRPQRAEQGDRTARLFSLEVDSGAVIPADLLSEGTLLTIGLLTVLHGTPPPRLVLLDDFDRALHPKAQAQLVACVKTMLAQRPDLQFVCTTHSPYVLDLFQAEDVCVLRADAQGLTRARRLTEHPEWTAWKETLQPDEFWSFVGEDWLEAPGDGR
jgi:predicted ATPase